MKPLAFIRTHEARALIERGSRCAGTPVSVHFVGAGQEGPKLLGLGQSPSCAHVGELDEGAAECCRHRREASEGALRSGRCVPFVCHMGFASTVAPLLPDSAGGLVLAFGPYCPTGSRRTLKPDAQKGLQKLGADADEKFLATLEDIHVAPKDAVPAVAQWTIEAVAALWNSIQNQQPETKKASGEEPMPQSPRRTKKNQPGPREGYLAADIAAALTAGNRTETRSLLKTALTKGGQTPNGNWAARRARAIALIGATLEALEQAGVPTAASWNRLSAFLQEVREAQNEGRLITLCMQALAPTLPRHSAATTDHQALDQLVRARITKPITLAEVAKALGKRPSTVTQRLRRAFGVSFTQYVGRLRVDMAKDLLRSTDFSVKEIAGRVGIPDQSNFSKLFRKVEGLAPLEYRTRIAKK